MHDFSWTGKLNIRKMSICPKLIFEFSTISVKIQE